jgi:hypothetical protein
MANRDADDVPFTNDARRQRRAHSGCRVRRAICVATALDRSIAVVADAGEDKHTCDETLKSTEQWDEQKS